MDKKDEKIIQKISLIQTNIILSSKKKHSPKEINQLISQGLRNDREVYSYMEGCSQKKQAKIMYKAEKLRDKLLSSKKDLENFRKENKEKEIFKIDASGFFSNREVIFKETYLEYGKKKIPYGEIKTVSYLVTENSINGIPSGTDYQFWLNSENESISLKLEKEEWGKIVNVSQQFIEPLLIQKILYKIFEKGEDYHIGSVTINNNGYSRKKFFGGIDEVLWKDNVLVPEYYGGNVILYREKNGKGKSFAQIPMSTENSVLLPELLKACVFYFFSYNKK